MAPSFPETRDDEIGDEELLVTACGAGDERDRRLGTA
jgi:hypothetical protein